MVFASRALARFDRLEGLAGLSVQDAELKLFAEKPKGEERSSARNGKSYADGIVGGNDTTNTIAADQEGVGAETESSGSSKKSRNKNRAGKKKGTIVQRGPLLITHSGETCFSKSIYSTWYAFSEPYRG